VIYSGKKDTHTQFWYGNFLNSAQQEGQERNKQRIQRSILEKMKCNVNYVWIMSIGEV
jgi:hypothetical protein